MEQGAIESGREQAGNGARASALPVDLRRGLQQLEAAARRLHNHGRGIVARPSPDAQGQPQIVERPRSRSTKPSPPQWTAFLEINGRLSALANSLGRSARNLTAKCDHFYGYASDLKII